ncbi:RluA family pseudouridine synthase [bacterium]|nr:RluA family pseudouridine synthase [bacterium]
MKILIEEKNKGERLDKFLQKYLKNYTRNQIQKIIKSGKIKVQNKEVLPHHFLKTDQEIDVDLSVDKIDDNFKKEDKKIFSKIKIIREEDEFIIIDKPAGLVVHPVASFKGLTLVDFLLKKYPEIKGVGEDEIRPGIVHRLDKDVSGVMVIARTIDSFKNLKEQFKNRKVVKKYIALVHGEVENDDTINLPIKRSNKGYKMAAVPVNYDGEDKFREAITHLTVLEKHVNVTLLDIKIETGRTHQIRTHLLAYGHPIVGDKIYTTKEYKLKDKKLLEKNKIEDKIYLKAYYLAFKSLIGGVKTKIKCEIKKEEGFNVKQV